MKELTVIRIVITIWELLMIGCIYYYHSGWIWGLVLIVIYLVYKNTK